MSEFLKTHQTLFHRIPPFVLEISNQEMIRQKNVENLGPHTRGEDTNSRESTKGHHQTNQPRTDDGPRTVNVLQDSRKIHTRHTHSHMIRDSAHFSAECQWAHIQPQVKGGKSIRTPVPPTERWA